MSAPATGRPRQSGASQFADAVVLLVLLFGTLFVTTFVLSGDGEQITKSEVVPIEQLDISAAEKAQFEKMRAEDIIDDQTASALVRANAPSNSKYEIAWGALLGTFALAAFYLGFVYLTSFREFREVIAARFGSSATPTWEKMGR